ncbi:unnamed protein product [Rotaria sp. Silwood2]|nr:unnamed protein product [Rotaria sp. Silwood2]
MTSSSIPGYRVTGKQYDCSYTIGTLARESIRQRIAKDHTLSTLFAFVETDYGHQLHQGFIERTRVLFPWYWDEICGLADGSEVPFEQILVLNFLNETRIANRLFDEKQRIIEKCQQLENEAGEKGCTTVLINRKDTNTLSLLHNEDHAPALYTTSYIIEADIQSGKYDDGKRESPHEKFIAYCYAGSVPGNAFGINKHGFAYSLNGLYPNFVGHDRLPRQILNRALLSIQNENELDKLLNSVSVAYGFCINGGFIHQSKYLLNYEIGPNIGIDNENYISKRLIINNEENLEKINKYSTALNYLVHYNHYERLDNVVSQLKSLESSYTRWKRGQELGEIFTTQDAIRLLGDDQNEKFSIFRAQEEETDVTAVTLCTIHINFLTLELTVYEHNPKKNNQPAYIYNLAELLA